MKDTITVLTTINQKLYLTKQVSMTDDGMVINAYDTAKKFDVETVDVDDLYDLAEAVFYFSEQPHSCFIRGDLIDPNNTQYVDRRKGPNAEGDPPAFQMVEQGKHWLMFDFDDIPNNDLTLSYEQKIEYLISTLPEYLHDVSYLYQWSSTMGLKEPVDGIELLKAHIWMWSDQPRTDEQLENWANSTDTVDPAPFRTVQANYTATPVFTNMKDPLEGIRFGLIQKEFDSVRIPIVAKAKEEARFTKGPDGKLQRVKGDEWAKMNQIGVDGRCHIQIVRSCGSWISLTGNPSDMEAWKRCVRERVNKAGHPNSAHYMSDAYLNQTIAAARSRGITSIRPHMPSKLPETALEKIQWELASKNGEHEDE